MTHSFKFLTSFAGALALGVGLGLSASAQMDSAPSTPQTPSTIQGPPSTSMPASMPSMQGAMESVSVPTATDSLTIREIVGKSESFELLNALLPVADLQKAGLVSTLTGSGTYTVLAPTDKAFAALPEGTIALLVKPENRDLLVEILSYHVIPGEITSSDLMAQTSTSDQGATNRYLVIKSAQDGTRIGRVDEGTDRQAATVEARMLRPDIMASNGVIHAIDQVLIPPSVMAKLSALMPAASSSTMPR